LRIAIGRAALLRDNAMNTFDAQATPVRNTYDSDVPPNLLEFISLESKVATIEIHARATPKVCLTFALHTDSNTLVVRAAVGQRQSIPLDRTDGAGIMQFPLLLFTRFTRIPKHAHRV